ncbi:hypothetical protein [Blautia massiliensis (ex Durand et al. 2017)]
MKDKEINNFIRETGKMGDIWTKEQVKMYTRMFHWRRRWQTVRDHMIR